DSLWLVDRAGDLIVLAVERCLRLRPHQPDNLYSLLETPQALRRGPELVAILHVIRFIPARTDPECQPPIGQHVYGGGNLGQQRWMTVAVASHHLTQPNP